MDIRWVGMPGGLVLGVVLLAGCGGGSAVISAPTAADLHGQVASLRAAVQAGNAVAAGRAIADLRSTIQRLSASGDLAPADGVVLLTQVDRIAAGVDARPTPTPTPTPRATPTPRPTVVPRYPVGSPGKADGERNGHGKAKGHHT